MARSRDFQGYGGEPPAAGWPGDARVAVSFVLNIEEGAELNVSSGDHRNEPVHEVVSGVDDVPDLCMESHYEYGTRAAYWRIMEVFARYGVPVTLNACGRAIELSPWLARDAVARGHEICCHGYRWEEHARLPEGEERAIIARALGAIGAASGVAPVGWHTRSSPSVNTRRILVEHGLLYDSDAYDDDLPHYVDVGGQAHLVLPYAFDTNDMRFHGSSPTLLRAADFAGYVTDAYDWLWDEGAARPKMMSVGLHLRIIGRPGRIGGLEAVLRHMKSRGATWFARRMDIARHWRQRFPATA
jgi:allantoinase